MNAYVLNYGPSYASEVYHYLSNSRILQQLSSRKIRILSLGCGFAPDLLAIERYVNDENLEIDFSYCGIDSSDCWQTARYQSNNATFMQGDVTSALNLKDTDLVFVIKLFSTLQKNKADQRFLEAFKTVVKTQLENGAVIVFSDVNSRHLGRDYFHYSVRRLFGAERLFYCDSPPYHEKNWTQIPESNIVFSVPPGLSHSPLPRIGSTVFFEYRK